MHHLALPGNVILLWPLNLCLMEDSSNLLHLWSETKPEYIRYEYKLRDWFTICSSKYFLIFRRTFNFFSPSIRFHIFSLFTLKLIWIFVFPNLDFFGKVWSFYNFRLPSVSCFLLTFFQLSQISVLYASVSFHS